MQSFTRCRAIEVNKLVKLLIPPLSLAAYKGQSGKIGVVGGSFEYTGNYPREEVIYMLQVHRIMLQSPV
jgi:hypothetical protein